jgi:hypothetical protein
MISRARDTLQAADRFEPLGVCNRNTAGIEEMDCVAERLECTILLETKTRQEHLERHAVFDVCESTLAAR